MRKFIVLLMVFGITTMANAGIVNVVGNWQDSNANQLIDESDIILLSIDTDEPLDGYDFDLHVSGPGTLQENSGGPNVNHADDGMMDMWWLYSGIDLANGISQVSDARMAGVFPIGSLVWGLEIHCDGEGPVLVDLTIGAGDTRVGEGGTNPGYILVEDDLGDLTITQVPEPATLVLLGLGGLFLRRRK